MLNSFDSSENRAKTITQLTVNRWEMNLSNYSDSLYLCVAYLGFGLLVHKTSDLKMSLWALRNCDFEKLCFFHYFLIFQPKELIDQLTK